VLLESLLNTIPVDLNYEIILIDDGSTDGALEWLHGLDSQNIHVIFNDCIQKQCWSNLAIGTFNLTIDNPVFSWTHPSIITITIDSNSPTSIPESSFQSIRLIHLSLDHEMVFSFSHSLLRLDFAKHIGACVG
jgi:hypothetical protein